jgi:hypothetical protein
MAFFQEGTETLRKVCQCLGIDPDIHPVRKITLEIARDAVVQVNIERYVDKDELQPILSAVKEVQLKIHDPPTFR